MSRSLPRMLCVLLALGVADACYTHDATEPMRTASAGPMLENPSSADHVPSQSVHTVVTLSRTTYLASDVSASATIGPEGGEIEIGVAGGKIIFPAGALSKPTRIKMTAESGWNVAYEFCPHGITFAVPVTIEQNLDYTVATGSRNSRTLQAGYFEQGVNAIFVDKGKSLARVSEVRGVRVDSPIDPRVASFFIYHFSGYIMSSGFAPTDGGGGDSGSP